MEILAVTSFDGKGPKIEKKCLPSLERSFLLNRILCLSSSSKLSNEQTILTKLTSNTTYFFKTSYVILIPVIIGRASSWTLTPIGYFDRSGMHDINKMIVKIAKEVIDEQIEEQAKLIQGLDLTPFNINNNDNDNDEKFSGSSSYWIPIKRSDVLNRNSSNDHDKVKYWLSKYQTDMINISTNVSSLSLSQISTYNLYENLETNNNFIDENENYANQSILSLFNGTRRELCIDNPESLVGNSIAFILF